MIVENKIQELTGIESFTWTYHPDADGYEACIWFKWTPSKDKPEGQPVSFESLQALDDEFGVVSVASHSSGRTGSDLEVKVRSV